MPDHDPIALFHTWQRTARGELDTDASLLDRARVLLGGLIRKLVVWLIGGTDLPHANAASLATADADGQPSARMVIVRGADEAGFVFCTDGRSRKAVDMKARPEAELLFHWPSPLRQVRIFGAVEEITREDAVAHWSGRPRASKISATASCQSAPLESRAELETRVKTLEIEYRGGPVPCPEHWVGFRVVPHSIEFWEGHLDRLHERYRFDRRDDGWQRFGVQP